MSDWDFTVTDAQRLLASLADKSASSFPISWKVPSVPALTFLLLSPSDWRALLLPCLSPKNRKKTEDRKQRTALSKSRAESSVKGTSKEMTGGQHGGINKELCRQE